MSVWELFKLSDASTHFHNSPTGAHSRNPQFLLENGGGRFEEIRAQEFTAALRTRGRFVFQNPTPLDTTFQNDLDNLEKCFEIGCNSAQMSTE